jgi:hypothetical protein
VKFHRNATLRNAPHRIASLRIATQMKQLFVLWSDEMRRRAVEVIARAAPESRVTIQGPKRTLPQNAKMHAMLQDIAEQRKLGGQFREVRAWKAAFMLALGHEIEMIPTIDEDGFFPLGMSTTDLSVDECSEMIELLYAKGAEWGIKWGGPEQDAENRTGHLPSP